MGFRVIFGALGYSRRQWNVNMQDCLFAYDVLPTAQLRFSDLEKGSFTYSGLWSVIQREQPAVIITAGFSVATTKLWLRSFFRRTPYVIWSGDIRSAAKAGHWFRRVQRRLLIHRAIRFVAYGSLARDYLLESGALAEDVTIALNTVDVAHFEKETRRHKEALQNEDGKKRLLFIGHLTPRKGVDRLLRVIQLLALKREDFVLDIIGAGSEQPKLEQLAQDLNVKQCVNFLGFKQKDEMPNYMARASCFIFPTRHDIWGLVLVEAMAAGLPCISSVDAGATCDLIQDGQTGFVVDFSDPDSVTEKLHWLLDHPEQCELMGQRARNFIEERATLKKSAEGFVDAIEKVLAKQI
jgi:glycosyltransferase involved in cell wall biosynthesis